MEVTSRLNSFPSALSLARPTWQKGQVGSPHIVTGIGGVFDVLMAEIIHSALGNRTPQECAEQVAKKTPVGFWESLDLVGGQVIVT